MDSHYVGKVRYSMLRRKEKEGKECFPVEIIKLTLGAECGGQLKKSYIFQVVPRTSRPRKRHIGQVPPQIVCWDFSDLWLERHLLKNSLLITVSFRERSECSF